MQDYMKKRPATLQALLSLVTQLEIKPIEKI